MKKRLIGVSIVAAMLVAIVFVGRVRDSKSPDLTGSDVVSGLAKHSTSESAKAPQTIGGQIVSETAITSSDQAKAKLLDEVLAGRNDNDPRLDREFNALTMGAKALLQMRYTAAVPEKRNERGTIVFLLGRNLTSESDFEFLKQVLNEPPCRSLSDCQKEMPGSTAADDLHHEAGTEVTLAYPQLVALKSIERYLAGQGQSPQLTAAALRNLEAAERSPVERVALAAADILLRYSQRGR